VTELTRAQVMVEAAGIAATPGAIEERARALVEVLQRVIPAEAVWLALRDPERGTHAPLATLGAAAPAAGVFPDPAGRGRGGTSGAEPAAAPDARP
jgi:hypothetical protein